MSTLRGSRTMIARDTGEIFFLDGVVFFPLVPLSHEHLRNARSHLPLPIGGWTHHFLGVHRSEYGDFDVQAVSDPDCHIHSVQLSFITALDWRDTSKAPRSRDIHEEVLARDLCGQGEFSWGTVFLHFNPLRKEDWLIVAYTPGPPVPLQSAPVPLFLYAHLREPRPLTNTWPEEFPLTIHHVKDYAKTHPSDSTREIQ